MVSSRSARLLGGNRSVAEVVYWYSQGFVEDLSIADVSGHFKVLQSIAIPTVIALLPCIQGR